MPQPKWWPYIPILAVLVVFGRVVTFPFVDWDDAKFLLSNPLIAGGEVNMIDYLFTPQLTYVVPVLVVLERLLYVVGGGSAWLFHLAVLLLHASNAFLVGRLAKRLGAGPRASVVAALCWACHPIVAEPVSWATGFKDVLALSLSLGCILAYLDGSARRVLLFGTLAFFSKPTTVLLPAALFFLEPRRKIPLIGLSAVAGIAAVVSLVARTTLLESQSGAKLDRINPLIILTEQVENYLAPIALHPSYTVNDASYWSLGIGLLLTAVVAWLGWRMRGGIRFALLFAVAAYLPSSQLVPFPRTMADSYLYAPSAGLCLFLALVPWPRRKDVLRIAGAVVVVFGLLAARQSGRWRSNEDLWLPLIQDEPGWAYPCILLAQGYRMEGRSKDVVRLYEQAFARQDAKPYLSAFGEALHLAGQLAEAQCVFEEDVLYGINRDRARRNLVHFSKFQGVANPELAPSTLQPRPPKTCASLRRPIERIRLTQTGK